MDLDKLIHDADPARGLEIEVPDRRQVTTRGRDHHWGEVVAAAFVLAVVVTLGVIGLTIGSNRRSSTPLVPTVLPFNSAISLASAPGVIGRTMHLVQTFPDPQSGPAWGLVTFQTRNGMTCLQAGRTESGLVGAIGIDGTYRNDLMFHPQAPTIGGLCEPDDKDGHAFISVQEVNTAASGGEETCLRHDVASPRQYCPASALRDVYFGLLGPDATSITYVGRGGRELVERTRGHNGAYLVVRPVASGSCDIAVLRRLRGASTCDSDEQGANISPAVGSGEIVAVTYRDGKVCRLPIPHGVIVQLARCPVVGYVSFAGPTYTASQITAAVTIRKLPARYYCNPSGNYRPLALTIPCNGEIPRGYFRFYSYKNGVRHADPGRNLLVDVSWLARAPVTNTNRSTYQVTIRYPRGCGAGGEGDGTHTRIHAGQHITQSFLVPTDCHGTYKGEVIYTPNLGPDGQDGGQYPGFITHGGLDPDAFLVGRFAFTVR